MYTAEPPEPVPPGRLYVVGEDGVDWYAALRCPCGCGDVLRLSLHPEGRPRWRINRHADTTVSLAPSVWRRVGCRSHFFLRRGRIEWCADDAPLR